MDDQIPRLSRLWMYMYSTDIRGNRKPHCSASADSYITYHYPLRYLYNCTTHQSLNVCPYPLWYVLRAIINLSCMRCTLIILFNILKYILYYQNFSLYSCKLPDKHKISFPEYIKNIFCKNVTFYTDHPFCNIIELLVLFICFNKYIINATE